MAVLYLQLFNRVRMRTIHVLGLIWLLTISSCFSIKPSLYTLPQRSQQELSKAHFPCDSSHESDAPYAAECHAVFHPLYRRQIPAGHSGWERALNGDVTVYYGDIWLPQHMANLAESLRQRPINRVLMHLSANRRANREEAMDEIPAALPDRNGEPRVRDESLQQW